jgi:broad specificity phosphatase PhoE
MIYILRHGESIVNLQNKLKCKEHDGDLTANGQQEARQAATWLHDKNITDIYTSPFDRTRQTAEIVGEMLQIEPTVEDDLHEMNCGELEGRTDRYAWGVWQQTYQRWCRGDWDATFPGGESFQQAFERVKRSLAQAADTGNTVLVTHGGLVKSVVPYLCVNAAAMQRLDPLANAGIVVLDVYDRGRYVCEAWNITAHLS